MTTPSQINDTNETADAGMARDRFRTNRHGTEFQVIIEPDTTTWIEVRRSDGELVDLQRTRREVDVREFADCWVAQRLVSITPLSRCRECGLTVELLEADRTPSRRVNLAVEFELWASVDAVDEANFDAIILCMKCRSQVLRRYRWLRPLLGHPTDPRRAR
jgi:hypothetical protein